MLNINELISNTESVVTKNSLYLFLVRPRGGAVPLHTEEAASAGVFPGQGQRVSADRAQPLSVLLGRRVQGRPKPSHVNNKHIKQGQRYSLMK